MCGLRPLSSKLDRSAHNTRRTTLRLPRWLPAWLPSNSADAASPRIVVIPVELMGIEPTTPCLQSR